MFYRQIQQLLGSAISEQAAPTHVEWLEIVPTSIRYRRIRRFLSIVSLGFLTRYGCNNVRGASVAKLELYALVVLTLSPPG